MLASAYVMAEKKPHVCEDDEDGCGDDEDYNRAKAVFVFCCKFAVPTAILATMCTLACIFVPTTKEMVAIKVIPAIASSEQASRLKGIGNDAIDVATEWFKSLAKAKEGETGGSKQSARTERRRNRIDEVHLQLVRTAFLRRRYRRGRWSKGVFAL